MQVLVVGMHRSGTSMVARMLHAMGLSGCDQHDIEGDIASDENPYGFWEHREVRALNEELLRAVGCDWHMVLGFHKASPPDRPGEVMLARMRRIIAGLDHSGPWMVKDPRLCLTLGHWLPVLSDPVFVFVLRHPLHVAISLRSRNDFAIDVGLALWEAYIRSALKFMRAERTIVVRYEQLLADPRGQIAVLRERLRQLVPIRALADEAELATLIDVGLNRSPKKLVNEGPATHSAIALYERLVARQVLADPAEPLSAESMAALDRHQRTHRLVVHRVSEALRKQAAGPDSDQAQGGYPSALLPLDRLETLGNEVEFYRSRCEQLDMSMTLWRSRLRARLEELESTTAKCKALSSEAEDALVLLQAAQSIVSDVLGAAPPGAPRQLVPGEVGASACVRTARQLLTATRELVDCNNQLQAKSVQQARSLAGVINAISAMRPADAAANVPDEEHEAQEPGARVAHLVGVVQRKRDEIIRALNAIADQAEWSCGSELGRDPDMQACLAGIEARLREARTASESLGLKLGQERTTARQLSDEMRAQVNANQALQYEHDELRGRHAALSAQHETLRGQHEALGDSFAELRRFCKDRMAHAAKARNTLAALGASWRWKLGDRLVRLIETLLMRSRTPLATDILQAHLENAVAEIPAAQAYTSARVRAAEATAQTSGGARVRAQGSVRKGAAAPATRSLSGLREATADAALRTLRLLQTEIYPVWERECAERAAAGQGKPTQRHRSPKVLIGTLYSGEREYQACKDAIGRQSYRNLTQLCIEHLSNREAHDRLYREFLGGDWELLIKIDADMVIVDERFVERVVDLHLADPSAALIQMAILDFYSGGEIQGVNAYTRDMRWDPAEQDGLFTDKTQTPRERRKLLWSAFARSVVHSPNPSPFQAFHFGVHRAVKAVAAADRDQPERAIEQLMYLERCHQHYLVRRDGRLALAGIGGELALRGAFDQTHVDYTDANLRTEFERYAGLSAAELASVLAELRERPVADEKVRTLLADRVTLPRRACLQSLLLLLPHVQVFGGVNRFLEIARHARRQGLEAVVGVMQTNEADLQRFRLDFPDVTLMPLQDVFAHRWDVVLCGDFSSCLMNLLPWIDADLSAVYLLNGWHHAHLNDVQIELAAPDVVLANSSYVARCYPRWAPTVVAGAVDHDVFFPPAVARTRVVGEPLRIAVPCGRMKPRKRVQDAVLACEGAVARGIDVELHLFDAASIRIESPIPIVQHIGLSRRGVAEFLRGMDLMLCPEEDAGWNNPAAEAMACGVPLVCTIAGSLDFAVHEDSALVVEARAIGGFTDAICRLALDPQLAASLGERGLERIKAFTWPALVRRLIDVMEASRPDRERRAGMSDAARKRVIAALQG